jgi:hypothetical protein
MVFGKLEMTKGKRLTETEQEMGNFPREPVEMATV